ncbi:MAG: radical SAM protein [Bacteroidales bacterium]|nr:radical SAM protein [Bacteroidales bacterium]
MNNRFHTLYFEATRNCNYSCNYCSTGSSKFKKYPDLPFEIIVERIFKPAWDIGTRFIDFSGGEFLLRKDHIQIISTAVAMGFSIGIVSNGSTLNEEKLKELKDIVGESLIISLGINSFDNDNIDTRDTSANSVLKTIDRINKFALKINMCVTIGQFNAETFADTVEKIKEMYLPYNRIPFVIRNCNATNLMFDKKILKEKFHPVLRKSFNGQISYVPYMLPPDVYKSITKTDFSTNQFPLNPSVGCWIGSYYAINPEGEVSPCPLFADQISGGNIIKESLREILFESELFVKITDRNNFKGKCGNCKYTNTCGGCRVMAYYLTGDVFNEDPTCFLNDLSPLEQLEIENETIKSFKNFVRMSKVRDLLKNSNL